MCVCVCVCMKGRVSVCVRMIEREREADLVDVFLVCSSSEVFSERLSITQTLQRRVHETSVPCRQNILKITEIP